MHAAAALLRFGVFVSQLPQLTELPSSPAHPPTPFPQTFQLQRAAPLPPQLLPYLRVVFATRAEDIAAARFGEDAGPVSPENETTVLNQVMRLCCFLLFTKTAVHF